ncbi:MULTISPECIES: hypothetical protein [unclassified Streptomyces]|uniref:hypothetical protein n=1 Tax=unclassified Streptomyces TaxID=2593676 RepID=UPI0006AF1437|nr:MULTISPECIES: hypothetical protein [unclassified Streptomyces]KOX33048.1 hypothetical protein ADL06_09925 [Streptomyces sp. NRRL F-6491]KOX49548.1 hypothetical protein ADL08_08620 [Streptomyces sp. NRRL F-6492]
MEINTEKAQDTFVQSWEIPLFTTWIKTTLANQGAPEAGTDIHRLLDTLLTRGSGEEDMVITGEEVTLLALWMVPLLFSQNKEDENSDLCQVNDRIFRAHGAITDEDRRKACICYG